MGCSTSGSLRSLRSPLGRARSDGLLHLGFAPIPPLTTRPRPCSLRCARRAPPGGSRPNPLRSRLGSSWVPPFSRSRMWQISQKRAGWLQPPNRQPRSRFLVGTTDTGVPTSNTSPFNVAATAVIVESHNTWESPSSARTNQCRLCVLNRPQHGTPHSHSGVHSRPTAGHRSPEIPSTHQPGRQRDVAPGSGDRQLGSCGN